MPSTFSPPRWRYGAILLTSVVGYLSVGGHANDLSREEGMDHMSAIHIAPLRILVAYVYPYYATISETHISTVTPTRLLTDSGFNNTLRTA